jgi:hypothetical protein
MDSNVENSTDDFTQKLVHTSNEIDIGEDINKNDSD